MLRRLYLAVMGVCIVASALAQQDERSQYERSQSPSLGGAGAAAAAAQMQQQGSETQTPQITSPFGGLQMSTEPGFPVWPGGAQPGSQMYDSAYVLRRREPPERHEFQDFVAQALGRELPMFGFKLFQNVPSTFSPIDRVPVTPDYVVGPGDELLISAWGQVDINYRVFVDRNGAISIPRIGTIDVTGVRYQDLEAHLKRAISRVFTNFDLKVTMGRLRSIQIFIVGQALRPGTYTVSSLSTLVNALFVAGGPSVKGSMRTIQLKRGDKLVTEFDMYDLLLKGDKSKDVRLLPGDVIYIPPAGQLAAISGSVTSPAIYEMRGRSKLADLIELAGGLTITASGQKVAVERIVDRKTRKVEDFNLDKEGLDKLLQDGDLVKVNPLPPRIDNAVTVRGNVALTARHPWRSGIRVKDVVPDREALIVPDYWIKRNLLVRTEPAFRERNDTRLRESGARTQGTGLEKDDTRQREPARTQGTGQERDDTLQRDDTRRRDDTIQSDDTFQRDDTRQRDDIRQRDDARQRERIQGTGQERLRAEVRRSLPEVNWDYAVIERLNLTDLTTLLIPFNLGRAVLEGDPTQNLQLQPGDVITIFSKDDIQVQIAKQPLFVKLEGEVAVSGVYQAKPGETLRQLVTRTGGISPNAYLFGAEFERESTRVAQQKRLDEVVDRLEQEVQRSLAGKSSTSKDEADTAKTAAEGQLGLVARLRKVRASGRIVLEIPPERGRLGNIPDLRLEDGDRFFIPAAPSTVSVLGTVYNASAFMYRPDKRLSDYLAQAGGPTKDADKGSLYLLRADGSVISKRQSGYFFSSVEREKLMPGDTIVVPENLDRFRLSKELTVWSQIFYQFALGVAGLKVLQGL